MDCNCNFKWPSMQRWQCPNHNDTLKTSQVTKVMNFPKFSSFGDLLWRIFEEFLENKFLWMIPWKFSKNSLELVPNLREFLRIINLRLSFSQEFFPRNSWEFLWKFWRNSQELVTNFYRVFWELNKRQSLVEFLRISQEFSPMKFLRNSPECLQRNY